MDLVEAVRNAIPPDATPMTFIAMLVVTLALAREIDPPRRRRRPVRISPRASRE
jgi:hypothetical protein